MGTDQLATLEDQEQTTTRQAYWRSQHHYIGDGPECEGCGRRPTDPSTGEETHQP